MTLVTENPQTDFLTGKYKLDQRTLNRVQGYESAADSRLTINTDGTIEMSDVPKGTFDFIGYDKSDGVTIDAKGNWKSG